VIGQWLNDEFTPATLQAVQRYEEKTNVAIMVLDANIEVLTALRAFYENLGSNKDFGLKDQCAEAILGFLQQLGDMIHIFQGQRRRVKLLVDVTENRKNLVSLP
jgi:hypothetical protein